VVYFSGVTADYAQPPRENNLILLQKFFWSITRVI